MLEFSYNLFNNKSVRNISGLCFIDKKKITFINNGSSKRIEHIDKLPRPAWHLLNPKNYFNSNVNGTLNVLQACRKNNQKNLFMRPHLLVMEFLKNIRHRRQQK